MIKFAVYAKVKAGKEGEFLTALDEFFPTVKAEAGTVQYDVCQAGSDPTAFLFFEAYETEEGQKAHGGSAPFKAYMEKIKPLLESPPIGMQLIKSAKG